MVNKMLERVKSPKVMSITLTDPERIVPVQNSLHDVSSHFRHTMPGYSIQVIEFDVQ